MYRQKAVGLTLLWLCTALCGCGSAQRFNSDYVQATVPAVMTDVNVETQEGTAQPAAVPEQAAQPSAPETTAPPAVTETAGTSAVQISLKEIEVGVYTFQYGGQEYTAVYWMDHWKVIDSYQITDAQVMTAVCQALIDEHPIHGADHESWRTAEDMAYEWEQHNLAFTLLADDSEWKESVKDVDFDPEDQGKSMYELFQERTGS